MALDYAFINLSTVEEIHLFLDEWSRPPSQTFDTALPFARKVCRRSNIAELNFFQPLISNLESATGSIVPSRMEIGSLFPTRLLKLRALLA